jgi:hypothetical protein
MLSPKRSHEKKPLKMKGGDGNVEFGSHGRKPLKTEGGDGNVKVQYLQQSFSKVDMSKKNYTPRVTDHKNNMSNIKMNISKNCTILGNNITR